MKLDIDYNVGLNDQQSGNYDCNGHNGTLMRVCDQNIVSGLTLQRLPSLEYIGESIHGMFIELSPPKLCLDNSKNAKVFHCTTLF